MYFYIHDHNIVLYCIGSRAVLPECKYGITMNYFLHKILRIKLIKWHFSHDATSFYFQFKMKYPSTWEVCLISKTPVLSDTLREYDEPGCWRRGPNWLRLVIRRYNCGKTNPSMTKNFTSHPGRRAKYKKKSFDLITSFNISCPRAVQLHWVTCQ